MSKKPVRYAYFIMDGYILCRMNARTLDCDEVEFYSKEEGWHSDKYLAMLFTANGNVTSASDEKVERFLNK